MRNWRLGVGPEVREAQAERVALEEQVAPEEPAVHLRHRAQR